LLHFFNTCCSSTARPNILMIAKTVRSTVWPF
jgi:hypothetical protein